MTTLYEYRSKTKEPEILEFQEDDSIEINTGILVQRSEIPETLKHKFNHLEKNK